MGDDLLVHPVAAVLAGVIRPVGGDPVGRNEGAVDDHERMPGLTRRGQCAVQPVGTGGQQRDGLARIPLGRGGAHPEPRGQFSGALTLAQVNQHEQGLPTRVQRMWARHRALLLRRVMPVVPAPVVAQCWRGSPRQAQLAQLLA